MLRGHGASRLCPPYARFTLPCRGRVDRPTGPARSGRPDGRLRRAGWGARRCRESQRAARALTPPAALRATTSPSRGGGGNRVIATVTFILTYVTVCATRESSRSVT